MGYRDDSAALLSHCEALEGDLAGLRAQALQEGRREQELRHTLRRLRWRLRLRALWGWLGRHKFIVSLALATIAAPTYCELKNRAEKTRLRLAREQELRRLGCSSTLKVVSEPPGAAVFTTLRLGETPLEARVCSGLQLVRLAHPRMLPWQRVVAVPPSGTASVEAELIAWRPGERPRNGTLIHSRPDGAVVFVDGREVGRTPLLVPLPDPRSADTIQLAGASRAVALWAEGHEPLLVRARASSEMWFYLRRVAGGEGRRASE
jgi:hypothetical protein